MARTISRLNFVSKRELWHLNATEVGAKWRGNYICRLRNRAKCGLPTNKLEELLNLASPDTSWFMQPYARIYATAKLATSKKHGESVPCNYFDGADVKFILEQRRRMHALKDNSHIRICKQYYPAKAVNSIVERCDWSAGPNWYQSPESVLRNLARIVAYLKQYDKQDLKQLKKATDPEVLRALASNADDIRRLDCGCYRNDLKQVMSENQIRELKHRLCKAVVSQLITSDKEDKYWGERENILINQVQWAAGRVSCANITNTKAFERAAKTLLEVDKVFEMHDIAKQLNMHAEERYFTPWRANRVNSKTYRLLKQCKQALDKGTPLEAVQQVVSSRSKQISMECYNRCIITPTLTPIENK